MPQRRSGLKELRKKDARRLKNLNIKTDLRKTTKKFLSAITQKNASEAQNSLKTLYKKLDKAAKRNILKKNTASRRKSRYSRLLASLN